MDVLRTVRAEASSWVCIPETSAYLRSELNALGILNPWTKVQIDEDGFKVTESTLGNFTLPLDRDNNQMIVDDVGLIDRYYDLEDGEEEVKPPAWRPRAYVH